MCVCQDYFIGVNEGPLQVPAYVLSVLCNSVKQRTNIGSYSRHLKDTYVCV